MQRRKFLQLSAFGTLTVPGALAKGTGDGFKKNPDSSALKNIAVLDTAHTAEPTSQEALAGAVQMLQEEGLPHESIDWLTDFSRFKLLILPDTILLTQKQAGKLDTYLERGGSVIASYRSGLLPDSSDFASTSFGLALLGDSPHTPDFLTTPVGLLGQNLTSPSLLMYLKGLNVKPKGAVVLAQSSTIVGSDVPASTSGFPAITQHGRLIYFSHPVFTQYAHSGARWNKQLVLNSLHYLLSESLS